MTGESESACSLFGARALAAVLLIGLGLRLGIAMRDLDVVDRLFVPDDTYYTLAIARSLAEGRGPSVDGIGLTSGFQPLLAFVTVPVFWVTDDPDVPLRFVLILLAIVDIGAAFLLALLARRLAGDRAALFAAGLWSLSPVAIANALGGLETSLALFIGLATIELWCRARSSGRGRAFAIAGAFAGLALLARIDSVFLVGTLGLIELVRGRLRGALVATVSATITVAPWWLYCTITFGSPIPESGAAVIELVAGHKALYLETSHQLAWAAGTVIGPPFADLPWLREALFPKGLIAVSLFVLIFALGAVGTRRLIARGDERLPILAFAIHSGAIYLFYSMVVPALWFFRRYLVSAEALIAFLAALFVSAAIEARGDRPILSWAAVGLCVSLTCVGAGISASYSWRTPSETIDVGLHGAKGYRQAAADVLALVPDGATLGAFQSGALSYYAPKSVTVVNLDGVVDSDAAAAVVDSTLADYARARGVTHFVDWPFNFDQFVAHSEHLKMAPPRVTRLGAARPQGPDRFVVFRLEWPDSF